MEQFIHYLSLGAVIIGFLFFAVGAVYLNLFNKPKTYRNRK